jgi:hypothetical protein
MKKLIYTSAFILIVYFTFNIDNSEAQWVQASSGINATLTIYSLTALGSNIYAGSDSGVYISTNNGTSWTKTVLNNKVVYSLATIGTVIFAGTGSSGVYSSSNNGANWTQTTLNNQTIYSLATSGNNIFAGASGNGVYISTNIGVNWALSSLGSHTILSLAASGANIYAGASLSGIYRSTNSGTNWVQTTLNNISVKSLAIMGSYFFAGSYSLLSATGIYRSTDGGTWTQIGLSPFTVLAIGVSGSNIFAGTSNGGYLSTNNGTNWIIKNQGFSTVPHIEAFLIANNYIFAGTETALVWRRSLAEIIGIKNISTEIPSEYSLSQNYPNPFNPTTNIRYEIQNSGNVKLIVFDALGREIETLVNEKQSAGTYEATFNASQYPSGMYFYRLETEKFSAVKKMILIK